MDTIEDLTVEVRDPDLIRRGQVDHRAITDLTLTPVWNGVGSWSLTLPPGEAADQLRRPGWGLHVTYADRTYSGPTTAVARARSADDSAGTWKLGGLDDNHLLADALTYVSPGTDDLAAQDGTGGSGYDLREGAAETVMLGLVRDNIGATAPAARRVGAYSDPAGLLDTAPDLGRGSTVKLASRFDQLGAQLVTAATAGGGLGFGVRQVGARWLFEVYAPRDLTAKIRFDVAAGNVEDDSYTYGSPEVTRPIVLGQGNLADRQLRTATTPETLEAEALWRRRIERAIDQRQTNDEDALLQAALEALTDGGTTTTGMTFTIRDDDKRFGVDYWLGDRVTVVPDDPIMFPHPDNPTQPGEFPDVITAGSLTFGKEGLTSRGTIGNVQASSRDLLLQALRAIRDQGRRLGRIERNT